MALIELIKDKYETVSIVGMSKNSGKTVTLNHLIHEAMDEGIPVGITSIGRDGENLDIVTETEKPRIYVGPGNYIATAREMLSFSDANIEIIKVTNYRSPLGEIVIGRVKNGGHVQIAGPQLLSESKQVSQAMLQLGAKFVIIDGALDRITSAAPSISQATILSTGAVVSRDMNRVIDETSHVVNLFKLGQVKGDQTRQIIRYLMETNKISIIDEKDQVDIIPVETALGAGNIIGDHLRETSKYIVIPGCLVKSTLEDLTRSSRSYKDVEIIVMDSTKIFINPRDWINFQRQGVKIRVLDKIDLIGLTINPYAPKGYYFEPYGFLQGMKEKIKDLPVMDLILGGE